MLNNTQNKLLTIDDLASLLSCKKSYIYRLNSEHRGPKITRIGPQVVRYRLRDVEEWIAEQQELEGVI